MSAVFDEDIAAIVAAHSERWERLRGAHLFVTGASGLIGRWMLHALFAADDQFRLGVRVSGLSRDTTRCSPTTAACT